MARNFVTKELIYTYIDFDYSSGICYHLFAPLRKILAATNSKMIAMWKQLRHDG